ncbi:uncharacterized protein DNG_08853 [Cephalotrichum gorgonifer]|uniref:Uncharacterized protein n=1 Tax=Cephalotrichum gorgonifer TaxID=2041049 RepID=A0AAE8SYR3_9PEZI|nr:uncharacterized protein DNG_08853 [Cephalotrichum gorgonifer]
MPATVITTSTTPSSRSSSSSAYYEREYREYGAAKHTSTSTQKGGVVVHNHNSGIEDLSAPSPSSYNSRSYEYSSSSPYRR